MRPDGKAEQRDAPATARVFFGLWPAPDLAGQLAGIAHAVASQFGGKPTRQGTIHLTLAFLGNVPVTQLPALREVAGRIAFAPFELSIDHLGFWPRQRLLWAGCHEPPAALPALAGNLLHVLGSAGFAVQDRERSFTPHVTLVRKLSAAPGADIARRLPALAPLSWPCGEFVLVRSQLAAEGANYQTLATFPARPVSTGAAG